MTLPQILTTLLTENNIPHKITTYAHCTDLNLPTPTTADTHRITILRNATTNFLLTRHHPDQTPERIVQKFDLNDPHSLDNLLQLIKDQT